MKQFDINPDSYKDFMNSAEWKHIATTVKNRDGNRCVICGETEDLTAHHIGYDDLRDTSQIVTLCRKCHGAITRSVQSLREVRKDVYSYGKDKLTTALTDSVIDFYRNSFVIGNSQCELMKHEDFERLEKVLVNTICNQVFGFHDNCMSIDVHISFENASKEKLIDYRKERIKRWLASGYSKAEIKKTLRVSDGQMSKLIKKIGGE